MEDSPELQARGGICKDRLNPCFSNSYVDKGLVKISKIWSLVPIYSNWIVPYSTWSLMKWYRMSICLLLECWTGFLLRSIALWLSQSTLTGNFTLTPKSTNCLNIHITCVHAAQVAIYSVSAGSKQHCFAFYLTMQHTLNPSRSCSCWLIFYHLYFLPSLHQCMLVV